MQPGERNRINTIVVGLFCVLWSALFALGIACFLILVLSSVSFVICKVSGHG